MHKDTHRGRMPREDRSGWCSRSKGTPRIASKSEAGKGPAPDSASQSPEGTHPANTLIYTSGLQNWEDFISGVKTTQSLELCRRAPGHSHHHVTINSRGQEGQEGYRVTQDSAPALPPITASSHPALLSNQLCPCSPGPRVLCLLGLPLGKPGNPTHLGSTSHWLLPSP